MADNVFTISIVALLSHSFSWVTAVDFSPFLLPITHLFFVYIFRLTERSTYAVNKIEVSQFTNKCKFLVHKSKRSKVCDPKWNTRIHLTLCKNQRQNKWKIVVCIHIFVWASLIMTSVKLTSHMSVIFRSNQIKIEMSTGTYINI